MKPLAITMGCPVGIGPEIILKFFAAADHRAADAPAVVVGDPGILEWCSRQLGIPARVVAWQPGDEVATQVIPVFRPADFPDLDPATLIWGRPDSRTGRAMGCCIETAVQLIRQQVFSGMTTCPITKKSLNEAGYAFPGHTEMLASLCRSGDYAMMMAGTRLRVTLVTIHTPLHAVPGALTPEKIDKLIAMTARSLQQDFAIAVPRLAVAALNPHAGEDGMFGNEEETLIRPAILRAQRAGWRISGPYPADTVFYKAVSGDYDAVVCMYHDQGLIPFKLLHFKDGVNVTIGLPIVRTSVDHGTAYDIAGKGKADPASLAAAVAMAWEIIANRSRGAQ
ncbi:MAG: 4-hydroxythreonine-4-phosphate dehydrogenase PdxA [Proteobacteria bacterium]|nr:4-hydroxythreonine-4-phosphate dehydrogenase PdxA [Pseudomonadota bacterium]MBU0968326.1 4-hydroxythreonine-4-phosphate dehydrogenase PdxA [Pseudomonadota bacterium]